MTVFLHGKKLSERSYDPILGIGCYQGSSPGNMKFGGMLVITHLEKLMPAMACDGVQ